MSGDNMKKEDMRTMWASDYFGQGRYHGAGQLEQASFDSGAGKDDEHVDGARTRYHGELSAGIVVSMQASDRRGPAT